MKKYEVIIIGAGPAGLRCAEILAKNNKKVLVLEKNKAIGKKICAGGLTIKDLELGIPDKILQKKFKRVIIHTPLQDTEINLDKPFIATINREDLGKWMVAKAVKAGAEIRKNANVTEIKDKFILVDGKEKIEFSFLVGADGGNSIVRKHLNIKTENFLQAFHYLTLKKFKNLEFFLDPNKFGYYVWIFPHKNFTSIGTCRDLVKGSKKGGLDFTIQEIKDHFNKWCEKKFDIKKCRFEASIINYDYKGYKFGNKFLIGDAGGFASGLTGEGIYSAIKSGEDVALKIINKHYNCPNIKYILKIKNFEEKLLRSFESGRRFAEVEFELLNLIAKMKFVDKELVKL